MSASSRIPLNGSHPRESFTIRILIVLAGAAILLALSGLALIAARPSAAAPGSVAISSYWISKTVDAGQAVVLPGDQISFTIRITNSGNTWITTLPLRDIYSPTHLSYGNCGVRNTADRWPDNYADDGQLDWSDLTAAAPYGFGTDLGPGSSFTIIVTFTAVTDTSWLPGGAAVNRAVVHDALADPDGSDGPLPEEPLPDLESSARVYIVRPTGCIGLFGATRPSADGPRALYPNCLPSIGGTIWHDVNFNGEMDEASDMGVDGALINTYRDDGDYSFEPGVEDQFYQSAITGPPSGAIDGHGVYDIPVSDPSICDQIDSILWIEIDGNSFMPGGALENMVLTSEETYYALPALVFPLGYRYSPDDIHFGFAVAGSCTISALETQPTVQGIGQPVSLSFRITNTGGSWITTLPLKSRYDPAYLTYGYAGQYASHPSDDNLNDGEITWQDLSSNLDTGLASVIGPEAGLPPGGSVTVVITFTAAADTSLLPGSTTAITATSEGIYADPDGPSGPLSSQGPLPASAATVGATIYIPTGITLSEFNAEAVEDHVRLTWRTANEVDILGFNVLRRDRVGGELKVVNPEPIIAEHAGAGQGARYVYTDARVARSEPGWYVLEVIHLDGRTERSQAQATQTIKIRYPLIIIGNAR